MTADAVLMGLLVASVASVPLLAGALWAARQDAWSSDLRHVLVAHGLAAVVGILLITAMTVSPRPALESASPASQAHFTFAAAGKFADVVPPPSGAVRTRARGSLALVWLWAAGSLVLGLRMLGRQRQIARLYRDANALDDPRLRARLAALAMGMGVRRSVLLARHAAITIPAVLGLWRPAVLVPRGFEDANEDEQDMVLRHELAHVRRRDAAATLLADLATMCFWFNPLVWITAWRLNDLQEEAADSAVIDGGIKPSRYASLLLKTLRLHRASPTVGHAMLGHCLMETRLKRILNARVAHGAMTRWARALLRVAYAGVAIGVGLVPAAVQLAAQGDARTADVRMNRALMNDRVLDSLLRPVFINHMADRYIAGAAIAVVHEGAIVYRAGFGRREVFHEVPVEVDRTIWRIGSITKVLTGAAVMQLVDRGLVALNADVNRYLRDVQVPDGFGGPVRVRHLLTHTAGFDQIGLGRHAPSAEAVRPLADFLRDNLVRIRPAGVLTTYDTYGITLAGHLVESVSELSYESYLQRHVFDPLGMHRSGIAVPPALRGDVAVGYGFAGSWEAATWEYMNTDPASTVNATATDMARFAIMLLEGGRFEGRQVLSGASARAMMTQQFTNHPDHPGYGFTLFEDWTHGVRAFSHGGSMEGYAALLYLVPEHRFGVFIALNQESGSLAHRVLTSLVDAVFPGHPPARAQQPRLAAPRDLGRFLGRYANSMYHHSDPSRGWRIQPIELTQDGQGRLLFGGAPAHAVGPLAFQRDDGVLLSFVEDDRGTITHFVVNQTVYERLPDA